MGMKQKKQKTKWPTQKNLRFSTPLILKTFSQKFQGLVLGLVGLIDAQGINVAQPIWLFLVSFDIISCPQACFTT